MKISDITPDDADRLQFGGSPSNGNNARKTLRRMLHKAREWKLLYEVPVIPLLEESSRTRLILPPEEKALIAAASQPCRDILILELDTGMRPYREICPMRWEYVDWPNKQYYVYSSKTAKGRRWVPLSDRAFQVLRDRHKGQNHGWIFPARNKQSKSGHTTSVQKAFTEARATAKIPTNVVLYCGRHTFGTLAMAESRNPAAVKDAMGHEELKTTMAYQHHDHVSIIREVINRKNENLYGHTSGHTQPQPS
ncbi:MAG TPA: site-specific integrase [Candidatus Angelobacter sp.]|nr:site-specific integrase [Candidatus Angelobacter sp.]